MTAERLSREIPDENMRILPFPPGPNRWETIKGLSHPVLNFFYDSFKRYGDVVRLPFLNKNIYLVSHPDDVAHVMKKRTDIYSKGGLGFPELKVVLGEGLGPTMGGMWKRQRKLYQPHFTPNASNRYASKVVDIAYEWAEMWRGKLLSDTPVNIGKDMLEMNLHVSCKTLIGARFSDEKLEKMSDEFVYIVQYMEHRVGQLFKFPLWVPVLSNLKLKRSLKIAHEFLDEIIHQRNEDSNPPEDLLTVILQGSGNEDDSKNVNLKRDHVLNFFFGGHETTGYTLAWVFYLLAKHPEVNEKVGREIECVLGYDRPSVDMMKQLPYTYSVIQETLRLYPIFPMLPRVATQEDNLRGYRVPRNTYINICPYLTNRHPDFWDNPDFFDPDRFMKGKKIHPFSNIPFGAGPTICIGRNFGIMSSFLIFVTLRQNFDFELAETGDINILMPGFSLQPEKPIMLKLKHR